MWIRVKYRYTKLLGELWKEEVREEVYKTATQIDMKDGEGTLKIDYFDEEGYKCRIFRNDEITEMTVCKE